MLNVIALRKGIIIENIELNRMGEIKYIKE